MASVKAGRINRHSDIDGTGPGIVGIKRVGQPAHLTPTKLNSRYKGLQASTRGICIALP